MNWKKRGRGWVASGTFKCGGGVRGHVAGSSDSAHCRWVCLSARLREWGATAFLRREAKALGHLIAPVNSDDHLDSTTYHVQATLDPPQLKHQQKRGPACGAGAALAVRQTCTAPALPKIVMPFACAAWLAFVVWQHNIRCSLEAANDRSRPAAISMGMCNMT